MDKNTSSKVHEDGTGEEDANGVPAAENIKALRNILKKVYRNTKLKLIVGLGEKMHNGRIYGEKSYINFINGGGIQPNHYKALAKVWIDSQLARMLRFLELPGTREFENLNALLATGNMHAPKGIDCAGRYYMYHGSYMLAKHYAVRAIKIECVDETLLTVLDTHIDRLDDNGPVVAFGALTFVESKPQILINASENKVGLCLMLGSMIKHDKEKRLSWMVGKFFAMNLKGEFFERRFSLVRDNTAYDNMVGQTGAFSQEEINGGYWIKNKKKIVIHQKHVHALTQLRDWEVSEAEQDPILAFDPRLRRLHPSKGKSLLRRHNAGA